MKKLILLSSFLFLIAINNFAQNKTIDSLKLALKNAKHDTTRCNILNAMVEAESDDNIWPTYNEKLLSLSEKNIKKYRSGQHEWFFFKKHFAAALNNLGLSYKNHDNVSMALKYVSDCLEIQTEIGDKKGAATSLGNIGFFHKDRGNLVTALEYYNKSLKIQEEIGDKQGVARSYNNMAVIYKNFGDVSNALSYYSKSLKIQEDNGDKQGIANLLNNIGSIYNDHGGNTEALVYYNKSLKIYKEIGFKKGMAYSLNNIGIIYLAYGDTNKALEYYSKSLKIREEISDREGIAFSYINIGMVYQNQGDLTTALQYFNKSLEIRSQLDDKSGIGLSLNYIGSIYLKQKNYQIALKVSEEALKVSKELGFPKNIQQSANNLTQIYKATGNYKLAYQNYELYILMRDSISNQENRKAIIKSQFKYEYEKKAAADSIKVAEEKKIVAVQLKQEKTQRLALYGGLTLVVLFAGFMFNRFRVTQKQKNIIELKEKETQQQNEIITIQKHLVEEKHKEITDSINYAERIQRSFLATEKQLSENLSNYFVLFKPKDVVSGDFYWSAKLSNDNFALVTADSTGHGVPGAIMSLLNVTSLEKAIEHHTNPADILNHTRQTIIERLKKDGSEEGGKDGMDCSLLVFDFTNKQLLIAAANNPVWIIRSVSSSVTLSGVEGKVENNYELIEIKPDKMPVGKSDRQDVPFTLHTIELQKGDTIYTLTDGFPDQFGGPNGKKFMSKKLKELLLANVHLTITQQKELLESTFKNWVGNLEQVDDVCVIGIKI